MVNRGGPRKLTGVKSKSDTPPYDTFDPIRAAFKAARLPDLGENFDDGLLPGRPGRLIPGNGPRWFIDPYFWTRFFDP
jgi:hypothetical protein